MTVVLLLHPGQKTDRFEQGSRLEPEYLHSSGKWKSVEKWDPHVQAELAELTVSGQT